MQLGFRALGIHAKVRNLHVGDWNVTSVESDGEIDAVKLGGSETFQDCGEGEVLARVGNV